MSFRVTAAATWIAVVSTIVQVDAVIAAEAAKPHLAIIIDEDEYDTAKTLPEFAKAELESTFTVSFVTPDPQDPNRLRNLQSVVEADIILISVRRRTFPQEQLQVIRDFVASGKPVVGIRTASHAFALRSGTGPDGTAMWPEFDHDVLGGNYHNHYPNWQKGGPEVTIRTAPDAANHPILSGVDAKALTGRGSLYKTAPLADSATPLLLGRYGDETESHPVAWTNQRPNGQYVFYTSLGHVTDFELPAYRRLLRNGIFWAAGIEGTGETATAGGWQAIKVPGTWEEQLPETASYDGFAWYHCKAEVPADWAGRSNMLYVAHVGQSCEAYVNGVLIGVSGGFLPQFQDGSEHAHRYIIPDGTLKGDVPNTIAIRVFNKTGPGGFLGDAPHILSGSQAMPLAGTWKFRTGDDVAWAAPGETEATIFNELGAAPKLSPFATVIRRTPQDRPLPPEESLSLMTVPDDLEVQVVLSEPEIGQPVFFNFDERGRMWVMNYLQYPDPAGLTMLSKDRWWRAVYDKTPEPPPHGDKGRDKITIHEDTDGDGVYDKHKTFVDGLNIATAFVKGKGGVWVLNPPYLLFYPDADNDDVPDGDPEVHLEGFGLEDTHSVVNSLRWGPDGWLYAAQGSTVTGHVKRYGTKEPPVHSQGQNIWRYHPETRTYEIFSEGGGNAFGVELNANGEVFSGHNGGNTRGFHYQQSAYLQKGFSKHGPLSNPYAFGYFPAMTHASVPRFTHNFLIYEADTLPEKYHGHLFAVNPLMFHVVMSDINRTASTYATEDVGYAIESGDLWFRPVDIKAGPDGAVYVADWYDGQLAHTANAQGGLHRESGRIYRIKAKGSNPASTDLSGDSTAQLIGRLSSGNKWVRQTAQRLLAVQADPQTPELLRQQIADADAQTELELLWALYQADGLDVPTANRFLASEAPFVRAWCVRLLCDDGNPPSEVIEKLKSLAANDPSVVVRAQLASSARRIDTAQAAALITALMGHDEDVDDPRQPLLVWWGLESICTRDRDAVLNMLQASPLWEEPLVKQHLLSRLMRRFASSGARQDMAVCARLLRMAPSKETVADLMQGFEEAYQGRSLADVPRELVDALSQAGGGSLQLRVRQGDEKAIEETLAKIADPTTDPSTRLQLVGLFGEVRAPAAVPLLLKLVEESPDDAVRVTALASLQSYPNPEIGATVVDLLGNLSDVVYDAALGLLSSREAWAIMLANAVDQGRYAPASVPDETVRKMTIHRSANLRSMIDKHWANLAGATTEQMQAEIQRFSQSIAAGPGNPYPGKLLFQQHCGKCHKLFESGGQIGPDLTTYKRDDIRAMLANIVNPSAEIREGFETIMVLTIEGRAAVGFLVDQDPHTLVLRGTDGQNIVVPKDEIDEYVPQKKSLMPEGLLKSLSDSEIRDLFAYLRSTQPLNN